MPGKSGIRTQRKQKTGGLGSGLGSVGRGGSAAAVGYAITNSDPNVKALWKFEETGTPNWDAVDSVNSITVAAQNSTTMSTTGLEAYPYERVSPGISINQSGGSKGSWFDATPDSNLNIGATDDVVWEFLFSTTGTQTQYFLGHFTSGALNNNGHFWVGLDTAPTTGYYDFKADDGTAKASGFTFPANLNDGTKQKLRMVLDRDGNFVIYQNGASAHSSSAAALSGKTFTANNGFTIGSYYNVGAAFGSNGTAKWYYFRISIGNDVVSNNLGGPGES